MPAPQVDAAPRVVAPPKPPHLIKSISAAPAGRPAAGIKPQPTSSPSAALPALPELRSVLSDPATRHAHTVFMPCAWIHKRLHPQLYTISLPLPQELSLARWLSRPSAALDAAAAPNLASDVSGESLRTSGARLRKWDVDFLAPRPRADVGNARSTSDSSNGAKQAGLAGVPDTPEAHDVLASARDDFMWVWSVFRLAKDAGNSPSYPMRWTTALERDHADYHGPAAALHAQLLQGGAGPLLMSPNAGGSSANSESLSFEFLQACWGMTLVATELQARYTRRSSIVDYIASYQGTLVGVSVTRALCFKNGMPQPGLFSYSDALALLSKKLLGLVDAQDAIIPDQAWERGIVHVWADGQQVALRLLRAAHVISLMSHTRAGQALAKCALVVTVCEPRSVMFRIVFRNAEVFPAPALIDQSRAARLSHWAASRGAYIASPPGTAPLL